MYADCFDKWQLMELAALPETILPYGQYMYFGKPNPPPGWVTVRPNERIFHNGLMIEKFIPREPRLSDEAYEGGEGSFPYDSPISTVLRTYEDGSVPTKIKKSIFPRPDFRKWPTHGETDTADPDKQDTVNRNRDMGSHNYVPPPDTQSDGNQNPQPKTGGKRSAHEPTKFQTFGDGRTRLTYLNLDRTSIVFQQRMSPRRADLTKERIKEMEKSFAKGVSRINTSERS